jgi:fumarate reductase subunit D
MVLLVGILLPLAWRRAMHSADACWSFAQSFVGRAFHLPDDRPAAGCWLQFPYHAPCDLKIHVRMVVGLLRPGRDPGVVTLIGVLFI